MDVLGGFEKRFGSRVEWGWVVGEEFGGDLVEGELVSVYDFLFYVFVVIEFACW